MSKTAPTLPPMQITRGPQTATLTEAGYETADASFHLWLSTAFNPALFADRKTLADHLRDCGFIVDGRPMVPEAVPDVVDA